MEWILCVRHCAVSVTKMFRNSQSNVRDNQLYSSVISKIQSVTKSPEGEEIALINEIEATVQRWLYRFNI